jgi:phage baseplate assembly protein W
MNGIDARTGKYIGGLEHLRQSVRDILTTPIGSRIMRRDYGSAMFRLIDRPLTPELRVEIYAAAIDALAKWEPRIDVTAVSAAVSNPAKGEISIAVEGRYLLNGQPVRLEGIRI